jgi:hypothetical protein
VCHAVFQVIDDKRIQDQGAHPPVQVSQWDTDDGNSLQSISSKSITNNERNIVVPKNWMDGLQLISSTSARSKDTYQNEHKQHVCSANHEGKWKPENPSEYGNAHIWKRSVWLSKCMHARKKMVNETRKGQYNRNAPGFVYHIDNNIQSTIRLT